MQDVGEFQERIFAFRRPGGGDLIVETPLSAAAAVNQTSNTAMAESMEKDSPQTKNEHAEDKTDGDRYVENSINLSLLDPPRFGWTVAGGVADLLPPHQSARRATSKRSLQSRRFGAKRARSEGAPDERTSNDKSSRGYSIHREPLERTMSVGSGTKSGLLASATSKPLPEGHVPVGRITAMQGSLLNVKSYHRGIEGDEPRDQQTGELRFPTKPSDTNHCADGPKGLEAMVAIHFPLTDIQSTGYDESNFYRHTIRWDLGNPNTPTPMAFAANLGAEFGLSYPEILDVAASIQKQLQSFCLENCSSAVPVMVRSGNFPKPTSTMCNLYGDVLGFGSIGGSELVVTRKPTPSTSQRSSTSSVASKPISKVKAEKETTITKVTPTSLERTSASIEKVFYRQVLSRLQRESDDYIRTHWDHHNNGEPAVRDVGPARCHLCQQNYEKCVLYPCGVLGHTVCEKHMLEKHRIALRSGSQAMSECPICTLRCSCSFCSLKLGILATKLKTICDQHGGKPSTTPFHGIHAQCVAFTMKDCKEYLRSIGAARHYVLRPQVPKIGVAAFPREVIDGIEIDVEYQEHYEIVFSSSGSKKTKKTTTETERSDAGSSTPELPNSVMTGIDGNTDYCMACNKGGSLVCCDVCPRSYHLECMADGTDALAEGKPWECPSCRSERDGLQSDVIDGSTQIDHIKAAYCACDSTVNESNLLNSLSIIVEMLELLMQYDFGYMFRTPVDAKQVPDYSAIIKTPMDLGTIKSRICAGKYKESLGDSYSLEGVALAALKDVELVWHNCYLFNVEGSAVYRMSGLLSRRAVAIRQKSFEALLPNQLKTELATYIDTLASERAEARKTEPRQAAVTPLNRYKLANIAKGGPQRRRPIVALDPDTRMVAKIYTTMQSLSSAVNIMVSRGLVCEYHGSEIDNANKLRTLVAKSAGDPTIRLFGYRWLYLDDLYEKRTTFHEDMYSSKDGPDDDYVCQPKEVPRWKTVVENVHGKVYYRNVEEALTLMNVDGDKDTQTLLQKLKCGEKLVLSDGVSVCAIDGTASLDEPVILKQDVVASGRTLSGFCSVASAFADWLDTMESSVCDYNCSHSIDVFQKFFLDKERNIDGIKYFSVSRDESANPAASAQLPTANAETLVSDDNSSKNPAAEILPANPPADESLDDNCAKIPTEKTLPVDTAEATAVDVQSPDPSRRPQHDSMRSTEDTGLATSRDVTMTNALEGNVRISRSVNVTQTGIKQNGQNGHKTTTTLMALVQKDDPERRFGNLHKLASRSDIPRWGRRS